MSDITVATLSGRVGSEPEMRDAGGTDLAVISLAVEQYRGPNKEPLTAWWKVNLWGAKSKLAQYITTGMKLTVHGRLFKDFYEKDGKKNYTVTLDADEIVLPDRSDTGSSGGSTRKASGKKAKRSSDELPF